MEKATQQAKESPSPARYILVTIQQPHKDACVKRTGLLVGFGGREKTMIGLEIDKTLSFHESDVYAITKVEWNFGKKHRMKFFEPTQNHPQMDLHMKTKAFELAKRLFGSITMKLGLDADQYFSAGKLYTNPPKHTAEEIVEPEVSIVERKEKTTSSPTQTSSPASASTYPDGSKKTTYVPPQQQTTSYTSKTYKKDGPTMFRRSSTELVKQRVAAISARLDELFAMVAVEVKEEKEDNTKGSQNEPAAPEKEQVQLGDLARHAADFCVDCVKREECIADFEKVYYCSKKMPQLVG